MKMLGRQEFFIRTFGGQSCCRHGCCSETAHQGKRGYKRHVKHAERRRVTREIADGIADHHTGDETPSANATT